MNCNPELAALLSQPWSNNACRGYVIYAMEHCGFSPGDIRRVVAEPHGLDFDLLVAGGGPAALREQPLTNCETTCPIVEQGGRAAPWRCRFSAFPPLDNGEAECVVFIP